MYASGEQWKNWMKDYRFGTLAFVPNGDLRQTVDALRNEYDPLSARTSMARITLTQPFANAPSKQAIENIESIVFGTAKFDIEVGPAITISESGRESDEVQAINSDLNSRYRPWSDSFSSVAWIIPDEEFVFKVHRLFDLK